MKRRITVFPLVVALAAVSALATAAAPTCRVRLLTGPEYLAPQESFLEEPRNPPKVSDGYVADMKPGTASVMGVEIAEWPTCSEIPGR
ncbi:hypothetical protein Hesp01_38460 [Herbidospora sp. NBRC 101105]|nr:hypothetical protein Hesp01_38460 [Herbidospora sp. NBRC 101105]